MEGNNLAPLRDDIVRRLEENQPADGTLVELVRVLDERWGAAVFSDAVFSDAENPPDLQLVRGLLARSVQSLGPSLMAHLPGGAHANIQSTVSAATAYIQTPSDETWDAFIQASTNSYPFGPGDGCHTVQQLADHCRPGSGCASGAGFLVSVTYSLGDEAVLATLREALLPWLRAL